jgi:hypothetical protein
MNVFQMRGMAFIPDKVKPDIDRESDAKTGVNCLNIIFKRGYVDLTLLVYIASLMILTSRLTYIYSIFCCLQMFMSLYHTMASCPPPNGSSSSDFNSFAAPRRLKPDQVGHFVNLRSGRKLL